MAIYVLRVFKSWSARDPERRWSNVYEVESPATSPDGLGTITSAIVAAEKQIHSNQVQFLSATVSTWANEPGAYDPLSFFTSELTGTGAASPVGPKWMDANVCFLVKYGCGLGRSGRRFYRGCIDEADVEVGGDGKFTLSAGSVLLQAGANFAAFRTGMLPHIAGGAGTDKIVLASPTGAGGSVERMVTTLTSGGVVINKRNHRYFDRAPSA